MKLLNKKGVEIKIMVGLIILLVAAFFVIYGLYSYYSEEKTFLNNIFPNLKPPQPSVDNSLQVRYDIENGSIELYDGLNWNDFDVEEIEGVTLKNDVLRWQFLQFFNARDVKEFSVGELNYEVETMVIHDGALAEDFQVADKGIFFDSLKDYEGKAGDVVVSRGGVNNFVLGLDNEMILYGGVTYSDDVKEAIKTEAIKWRDSVFLKPYKFSCSGKGCEDGGKKLCVEKYNDRYLVVDYSKEVEGDVC